MAPPRRHDRDTTGTPFVLRYASSGRARLALPPEELARAASIEAKWVMHPAEVSAEEVKAARRAAMTRIEVVEAVREITVEVPGRRGLPGLRPQGSAPVPRRPSREAA
ncbi:hypothetical protein Sipo8835_12930 [Streptomyces ipomoeae]|uniref:Uncharacterized protein n=1 Tax=Streptomyces ipomoeae TaxID=103232 RepID=A0AAE9B1E2_9ACTN|nr:hypothetical protein [Streptomyces ipomoeae]MDX2697265.1 hypothetical protein [Streptomyces ipomoeae]MDX2824860.1 hypothetical protein [Streptomyces ipomoeae]MDX2843143.1 hypothetical protein [Streptomyces ipomoeae]TQE27252.1 hypothetical protein Sipo7851_32515 [Streptomyces ipomoeae]TQE35562.1 hypothetical protein Sipo8835_12930 [Streptomyces ipomoeae]